MLPLRVRGLVAFVPLHTHNPDVHDERLLVPLFPLLDFLIVPGGSADLTLYNDDAPAGEEGMMGMVLTEGAGDLPLRIEGPGDDERREGVRCLTWTLSVSSEVARASDSPS